MSEQEETKEYFREMGQSSVAAAAKALGIKNTTAHKRVHDLVKRGWLKKVPETNGIYEFHQLQDHEHGRVAELQQKIWRAARIAKTFTAWDLAMYSGASLKYVRQYIKFLKKRGLILPAGKRGRKELYRCKEEVPEATPRMKAGAHEDEIETRDLLDLGWEMMRALRDGDMETARETYKAMGEKIND